MKVSVLIAHYNRPELLERTLWLLENQEVVDFEYEVHVIDDGSEGGFVPVSFPTDDHTMYSQIRNPGSPPRSPNTAWWYGYERSNADFIILGHPEIMPPLDAIRVMLAGHDPLRRSVPTLYLIPIEYQQNRVDQVDWKSDLKNLQKLPGFWSDNGHWGYTNRKAPTYRHHFGFTGQYRNQWERWGFLPKTDQPRKDDAWMREQEVIAGFLPLHRPEIECYHQWHPRLKIHRDWQGHAEASKRIRRIREADKIAAKDWRP